MRKTMSLLMATTLAVALLLPTTASAETGGDRGPVTLGADFALVIPLGDWADFASVGLGGLFRFEYEVAHQFDLRARVGYIYHLKKSNGGFDTNTTEVPLLFGAKYSFSDTGVIPYISFDLGITRLKVKISNGFGSGSGSDWEFGLAAGGGLEIGNINVGVEVWLPSFDAAQDDVAFLGMLLTFGYNFLP